MNAIWDTLFAWGRVGGAVLSALSLAFFALCFIDLQMTGSYFVAVPGIAVALLVPGILLLIFGDPANRSYDLDAVDTPVTRDVVDLLEHISTAERPLWVCTDCRAVSGPGMCMTCGKSSTVMEIRDDEDLRMVVAALS